MRAWLAVLAWLVLTGPAPLRADTAPAATLAEASALMRRGDPAASLARIEALLNRSASSLGKPDLAVVHLEAARAGAAAGQPDRARVHLVAAEQIVAGSAFQTQPLLRARLQVELARTRERIGDFAALEKLLTAALPLLEASDSSAAADALNARGRARLELLRLRAAQEDFTRAVTLLDRPNSQPDALVAALTNLTLVNAEAGNIAAANAAARRARIAAGGDVRLLRAADFAEAQARLCAMDTVASDMLLERVVTQSAPDDPLRAHALLALAASRFDRGLIPEAADTAAASIEAYRTTLGGRHPAFGRAIHTLGTAQSELGNVVAAKATLARSAQVLRDSLGPNATQTQETEVERGWLDLRSGDILAAERRARAALTAYALVPPPDRRPVGIANILLGLVREAQGREDDAASQFRLGQSLIEAARGPDSPDLGFSLVRLGRMLTRSGHYLEAAAPIDRAIEIYSRVGNAASVRLSDALTARAELRTRAGSRRGALDDTLHALALLRDRVGDGGVAGGITGEAQQRGARELFTTQARLLLELADGDQAIVEDAFAASQQALTSRAGEALRHSAARLAAEDNAMARLLRDRETAALTLRQADAFIFALAARTGDDTAQQADLLRRTREAAASRLHDIDSDLARSYPNYAEFLSPHTATIAAAQAALRNDEAVLAPVAGDTGMLLWIVRRDAVRAVPVPVTRADLADLVSRIRTGVDFDAAEGRPLPPFDIAAARSLHAALVAPAEAAGLLDGVQDLLLVPDGALQSLPPHLLLDPQNRWLVRRYAVTVAPSIASAIAARAAALRPSTAPMAFLGVGDPIFAGYEDRSRTRLRGMPPQLRHELSTLSRLRETADEVRQIATLYGKLDSRLLLQEAATARGVLEAGPTRFRVIAFSTHALMAGDLPGLTEPAIVLTAGDDEAPLDGLLTASGVASMDLDADLVLLSGCNTAASDGGPYAESLSGLARAFLQAGARTLLVSHWSVVSKATVGITTSFVAALRADPAIRPADALRTAMLRMIDSDNISYRHPAYWAPFVVVGR